MDTLYLVGKIVVSIIFFSLAILMIVLSFKAKYIKEEFARIEKMCNEDLRRIYETGSIVTKIIIELVLAKQSLGIGNILK